MRFRQTLEECEQHNKEIQSKCKKGIKTSLFHWHIFKTLKEPMEAAILRKLPFGEEWYNKSLNGLKQCVHCGKIEPVVYHSQFTPEY